MTDYSRSPDRATAGTVADEFLPAATALTALTATDPGLAAATRRRHPSAILRAVAVGASAAERSSAVRLLADPTLRDRRFYATPAQWAAHFGHPLGELAEATDPPPGSAPGPEDPEAHRP